MSSTVRITSKNQITLPPEVRHGLGVTAGDEIDIIETSAGVFEVRARRENFSALRGMVKLDRHVSVDDLDRWVAEARDAAYQDETS
ncbi:hypothetical protein BJF93_23590 [Xaviernesmea oryzae]|uniref:SpoVT-AbrB domain-containing protein n=1 Tax=Xaviernesmea oryzae TaxID=464029 RepID=A0A1Q9B2V5_9HYPH|nr:AbrB/MazE/SpoVT family DNA-binding domain-containing protein [Xaviernesmea oryzae]OLP62344.1 hypothetical protein BJF93_23590 [Xaviernesmea oryzae]SEL97522.1 looped-hinge helix DNA binding domain-containing protein, AbrB family [Xaviernesmea oryzae]